MTGGKLSRRGTPWYECLHTVGYLLAVMALTTSSFSQGFVLAPRAGGLSLATSRATASDVSDIDEVSDSLVDDDDVHPSAAWLNDVPIASNSNQQAEASLRRTIAVDYGTQAVGLATGVGFSSRMMPGIVNRGSDHDVARRVLIRARGEGARDIVVGLPLYR